MFRRNRERVSHDEPSPELVAAVNAVRIGMDELRQEIIRANPYLDKDPATQRGLDKIEQGHP